MPIQITRGPENWEILQQTNGRADVVLEGTYTLPETIPTGEESLWACMLDETTGAPVVEWVRAEASEGAFSVTLRDVPAGGLYRLEIRMGKQTDVYGGNLKPTFSRHHIGVGDNYIVAGQSNASGTARGEIEEPHDLFVHVLRDASYWDLATHPLDEARCLHSPWIAFAHTLARKLGYPIGLIPTAVGGSLLSSWLPEERGELYRGMLDTVRAHRVGVKGVLWVQGCSEAMMKTGHTYLPRLLSFIDRVRADLGRLPILMLQINRRMDGEATPEVHRSWSEVREAQRQAAHLREGVYITAAFDARLSDGIHHGSVTDPALGERLGRLALHRVYGIGVCHDAPEPVRAVRLPSGKVEVTFTNTHTMQLFAIGERIPLLLKDSEGEVAITRVDALGDKLYIAPARPLGASATLTSYYGEEQPYFYCDLATQIPGLAFLEFPIED